MGKAVLQACFPGIDLALKPKSEHGKWLKDVLREVLYWQPEYVVNIVLYCSVLQQAGRNPSQKTLNKYWTSQTTTLNFDDFCTILKQEKTATKAELLEAFGKLDTDNTGYILHDELYQILTMVSVSRNNYISVTIRDFWISVCVNTYSWSKISIIGVWVCIFFKRECL